MAKVHPSSDDVAAAGVAAQQISTDSLPQKKASLAAVVPAVFRRIVKGKAGSLTWKDISFSVKVKGGRKEILHNVSGHLRPGSLTCILGPSGSGKTTLLNSLSGRSRPGGPSAAQIDGSFELDGRPVEPWHNQHIFGYVMQEDSLFATETPREILSFASKLRLCDLKPEDMTPLVANMLESLGLQDCADTMAGGVTIKGISGGQRKRTSIAAELITNPAITFLDEPTSGLDTAAAYRVVSVLKELAKAEQSVMCTVHQPSSEIFELFDSAIFLARGRVVFQGHPSRIRGHFAALGHRCPQDYNPADFVMFLLEMSNEHTFATLAQAWSEAASAADPTPQVAATDGELPSRPTGKGFCAEFALLISREFRSITRDKATLRGRFGITAFLNLLFSFIFFQVGDVELSDYDVQTHLGALTMVGINSMMGAVQPAILSFPAERPVFLREHASQMYGVVPYVISKMAIEMVLLVFQVHLALLITYFLMGFQGVFHVHVVTFFLLGLASSSVGLFLGSSIADMKTAMEVTPLAFVPQILFAGFFIKMDQIPVILRWCQYLCGLKWGMNVALVNELGPLGGDVENHTAIWEANDIDADHVGLYLGVLIMLIVLFRGLAMVRLRAAAKSLY